MKKMNQHDAYSKAFDILGRDLEHLAYGGMMGTSPDIADSDAPVHDINPTEHTEDSMKQGGHEITVTIKPHGVDAEEKGLNEMQATHDRKKELMDHDEEEDRKHMTPIMEMLHGKKR